ncbi:MAG: hypothetical protein ACQGVC_20770 [Myxococcota bacterium]
MSELRTETPTRDELRRAIAGRLHGLVVGYRPVAEDLLADRSRVDLFGVDGEGRGVIVAVGEREEDALLLVARVLAQRSWVAERLPDWLKLAPDLGVRPELPPAAWILCPGFGSEARTAAAALPAGAAHLATWRFVRNGSGSDVLIEPLEPQPADAGPSATAGPDAAAARPGRRAGSDFRTGLSDQDLGLTDEEIAEFE